MTLGYFIDLMIINEIRKENNNLRNTTGIGYDLAKQNGFLFLEISKYIDGVFQGTRPGKFSKHKNYDKHIEGEEEENFIKLLYLLYEKHKKLWELEDIRRNLSLSDTERLKAADEVSIYNKQRNNIIEKIDFIVNENITLAKGSL